MSHRPSSPSKLRATAYPVLLAAALAATTGITYLNPTSVTAGRGTSTPAVTGNEVYLPIEVMGSDGTTRAVTVMVGDAGGVDSLYIVGHALGYHNSERLWNGTVQRDGKASYRVNGGAWRPISNANARVRWPERVYLGIGGGYHTVRLTVPVSGVQGGANDIEFRFNATEGVSSGFRILELDLRAGTQSRVSGTTFIQDDPAWWTAPPGSDPMAGRSAWEARNVLRESPLPGAPIIVASCSDCHAYNGFDLKYFNYSNTSIEARAQFHGMSGQQGRDIAAYIRSVNLHRSDGQSTSPYARPWNPPYQPGPGLTDRGEEDWAAGAGLEWVLDSDDETAYYLFPDAGGNVPNVNPTDADIARAVRVGTWSSSQSSSPTAAGVRMDIQNAPIALQYPDWNNWLPDVHPFDAFGYGDFTSIDLWPAHLEMYERFDTPQKVAETIQRDRAALTCLSSCPASGFDDILHRVDWNGTDGPLPQMLDVSYGQNPSRFFISQMSVSQWQAVKTWEVLNRYDLQDVGDEMFNGLMAPAPWVHGGSPMRVTGARPGQVPPFFWPGSQNIIFDMAPHMNARCAGACPGGGFPTEGPYGPPGSDILSAYFTTAWYDIQLMLSREQTGLPASTGGGPIDWNYQTEAVAWAHTQGVNQWWRLFRGRVIATQSRNNPYAQATNWYQYAFNSGPGFTATNANFWEVVGRVPQHDGSGGSNYLAGDIALTRRALEQYWNEWFNFARSVPVESWVREPEPSGFLESPNVTPQPHVPGTGALVFDSYTDANNTYRLPPLILAWGMRPEVADNVARWGELMWPSGNWEQWFLSTGSGDPPGTDEPSALLTVGQATPNPFRTSVTISYELGADTQVLVQAYDALGRLVATLVDEEQSAGIYAPALNSAGLQNGLYLVRVRAGGESASRTMVLAR